MGLEHRKFLVNSIHRLHEDLNKLREHPPKSRETLLWEVGERFYWLEANTREIREELGMSNKKQSESGWVGFVDVTLTSKEKELFGAWDMQGDDLWVMLVDAMTHGHKVSLSYNRQNETFGASFTGTDPDGSNKGFTLSAFAADWYTAVRVLVFKHAVLLDFDWKNADGREGERIG